MFNLNSMVLTINECGINKEIKVMENSYLYHLLHRLGGDESILKCNCPQCNFHGVHPINSCPFMQEKVTSTKNLQDTCIECWNRKLGM